MVTRPVERCELGQTISILDRPVIFDFRIKGSQRLNKFSGIAKSGVKATCGTFDFSLCASTAVLLEIKFENGRQKNSPAYFSFMSSKINENHLSKKTVIEVISFQIISTKKKFLSNMNIKLR